MTLDIGNQFLVAASTDGPTWTEVLRENARDPRPAPTGRSTQLDLNALRGGGRTVYLRVQDSKPDDGWGGWVAGVRVVSQR